MSEVSARWRIETRVDLHDVKLGKIGTYWRIDSEPGSREHWYADVSKVQREAGRLRAGDDESAEFATEQAAKAWLWRMRLKLLGRTWELEVGHDNPSQKA